MNNFNPFDLGDYGPTRLDAYQSEAYNMGCDTARAAATWIADGNTKPEAIAYVIGLMDDGDPQADDYLPAYPNLSGEWASDQTPTSLARDIAGPDFEDDAGILTMDIPPKIIDAIADAWEAGVSATFQIACEAELHKWVDDPTDTPTTL